MKQSLFSRVVSMLCAVVVASVLLESVAELGLPPPADDPVAAAATSTVAQG